MATTEFTSLNCSLADTLQLVGDRWAMLIIREAFFGTHRFEIFQKNLGIARNILTTRLHTLCDNDILLRVPVKTGARRHGYKLSDRGYDLLPAIIALNQWGDRWLHERTGPPIRYLERRSDEEIDDIVILSSSGCQLSAWDLKLVPGPGATEQTIKRLQQLELDWKKQREDKRKKISLKKRL